MGFFFLINSLKAVFSILLLKIFLLIQNDIKRKLYELIEY